MCLPSRLSILAQMAWNVPTASSSTELPRSPYRRSFISRAALFVKVTAIIWRGRTPHTLMR